MRKKFGESFFLFIIPLIVFLLIVVTRWTMRITYLNRAVVHQFVEEDQRYILAFWHGRLLMMPYACLRKKLTALISRHRDGEFIARTMAYFGFHSTRGSTTSGAVSALKEILRKPREGYDIAITPDGPRGPRYQVQMGVIEIARLTGLPIVPVSFSASRKKIFQSWDRFLLPYPFSKGIFYYGNPMTVHRDASNADLNEKKSELERTLNELTEKADHLLKK
jgi:lysophospholipid acyltransferase (LPLAT)-like uncharacterized protein